MPGVIVDDHSTGVVGSREEMAEGLERSYPLYKELGLSSVGYELLEHEQLSGALTRCTCAGSSTTPTATSSSTATATTSCDSRTTGCVPASASRSTTPRSSGPWPL